MFRTAPRAAVLVAVLALAACTVDDTNDDGGTPGPDSTGSGAPLFEEGVDPNEPEAPITDDYSAP
jgi:hypothetical protein